VKNAKAPMLVIGGTRGTGLLIARLRQRGTTVRVLARDPAGAAARLGPGFELIAGDLTRAETLPPAVAGAGHIVFTAGAPSGRYAPESLVRATDYQGVVDTLAAARHAGFPGRFAYLDTFGIATPSLAGAFINLPKRNTLAWRRRAEDVIRGSGLDYTIIRVGFLRGGPAGLRAVVVGQDSLPLALIGSPAPTSPKLRGGARSSRRFAGDVRDRLGQGPANGELEEPPRSPETRCAADRRRGGWRRAVAAATGPRKLPVIALPGCGSVSLHAVPLTKDGSPARASALLPEPFHDGRHARLEAAGDENVENPRDGVRTVLEIVHRPCRDHQE